MPTKLLLLLVALAAPSIQPKAQITTATISGARADRPGATPPGTQIEIASPMQVCSGAAFIMCGQAIGERNLRVAAMRTPEVTGQGPLEETSDAAVGFLALDKVVRRSPCGSPFFPRERERCRPSYFLTSNHLFRH
jgi:hypothetical protein